MIQPLNNDSCTCEADHKSVASTTAQDFGGVETDSKSVASAAPRPVDLPVGARLAHPGMPCMAWPDGPEESGSEATIVEPTKYGALVRVDDEDVFCRWSEIEVYVSTLIEANAAPDPTSQADKAGGPATRNAGVPLAEPATPQTPTNLHERVVPVGSVVLRSDPEPAGSMSDGDDKGGSVVESCWHGVFYEREDGYIIGAPWDRIDLDFDSVFS